jgi:hypothetical protein
MDPTTSALILVGYQNDHFAPAGILRAVVDEPHRVDQVPADTLAFVRRAAPTGMTIVSMPTVPETDDGALAEPIGILNTIEASGAFRAGTSDGLIEALVEAETIAAIALREYRDQAIAGGAATGTCPRRSECRRGWRLPRPPLSEPPAAGAPGLARSSTDRPVGPPSGTRNIAHSAIFAFCTPRFGRSGVEQGCQSRP